MKDCSIEVNYAVENCRWIVLGHIGRTIARSDQAGFVRSRELRRLTDHDHPDNLDAVADIRMPPGQLAGLASVPGLVLVLVLVAVVGLWHAVPSDQRHRRAYFS